MTGEPPEHESGGHLEQLSLKVLVACGLAGLVLGWVVRHAVAAAGSVVPVVSWVQALVLFFVAGVLVAVARLTRQALAAPARRPEPHQLVNRLVLARACSLVGALVAGAYAGYAVSWLGVPSELSGQRVLRGLVAAAGALAMAVAAVVLERACRVPPDQDAA